MLANTLRHSYSKVEVIHSPFSQLSEVCKVSKAQLLVAASLTGCDANKSSKVLPILQRTLCKSNFEYFAQPHFTPTTKLVCFLYFHNQASHIFYILYIIKPTPCFVYQFFIFLFYFFPFYFSLLVRLNFLFIYSYHSLLSTVDI